MEIDIKHEDSRLRLILQCLLSGTQNSGKIQPNPNRTGYPFKEWVRNWFVQGHTAYEWKNQALKLVPNTQF